MLELGHDNEADNDQQKPRADLAEVDDFPAISLVRVVPGAKKRSDIFGDPDEEPDQKISEGSREIVQILMLFLSHN